VVTRGRDESRLVKLGVFPVGIDAEAFSRAHDPAVHARAEAIRNAIGAGTILLGVDRLDYTKGLVQKLRAYRTALAGNPGLQGRVTLVQLVVPSREQIPEYRAVRAEVEGLVASIQGEFGRPGWSPVHYTYGTWDPVELLAHYRAADIALVTPLRDGMNLVAKEYCLAGPDDGVLILSRFAGAAAQLGGHAVLVDPFDAQEVTSAILRARAMPGDERRHRVQSLRAVVRGSDARAWMEAFLAHLLPFPSPRPDVAAPRPAPRPGAVRLEAARRARRAAEGFETLA
jgi:trehalose 6-phosphate synthase